ncbi:hypothetical protein [Nocardia sp. NPDC046763]|uniref:hypothetical protein n=1 Tax=Nocardia sp. NPDC046763 TaxID=3155256 RepID=UPI00340A5DDF
MSTSRLQPPPGLRTRFVPKLIFEAVKALQVQQNWCTSLESSNVPKHLITMAAMAVATALEDLGGSRCRAVVAAIGAVGVMVHIGPRGVSLCSLSSRGVDVLAGDDAG